MKLEEYIENPKICKNCSEPLPYNKRYNTFCNSSCAGIYNNKNRDTGYITKEFRENAREKALSEKHKKDIFCPVCNKPLTRQQKWRKRTYCSNKCRASCISEETNEKIRQNKLESVRNGTHKGWTSRNVISYPEKFFIEVLKNNKLEYKQNFVISKRDLGLNDVSNYFLDFYFEDKKIDLEIDGKQHSYKDRKEKDIVRDKLLEDVGIKVYRIKWKNPINEDNKEYLEKEIQKFLNYINYGYI